MQAQPPAPSRYALPILLGVVFIDIAGFGVLVPLLAFYGQSFHAPRLAIFLLFSAFSLGNLFAEPMWGRLSDRIGRRPVLMVTIFGSVLTYLALAFAPNIWLACLARIAGGVLAGNISTVQSYIADITPLNKRASRLSLLGVTFGAGFITGPSLGGLLARPSQGTEGFHPPLFLAAAFCLIAGLGVLMFVKESRVHVQGAVTARKRDLAQQAAKHPVISRAILINILGVAAFSGVESVIGLWAQARYGWGPREIGFCLLALGLTAAAVQGLITGRLVRRLGEGVVLSLGVGAMGLGMVAGPFISHWPSTVLDFMVIAVGQSLCFPNVAALISRSAGGERQGAFLGLNLGGGAFARIIGPLIAGPLYVSGGPNAPFWASAILLIPAVVLGIQAGRAAKRLA